MKSLKPGTVLLLTLLALVSTWVACTAGVPALVPEFGGIERISGDAEQEDLPEGLIDLGTVEGDRPELPTDAQRAAGLATLQRGIQLSEAGNRAGAVSAFDQAAEQLPAFADWAHILAAREEAAAGDARTVQRRVEDIEGGASAWSWRALYDAHAVAGDSTAAAAVAEAAAGELELPVERALAWSRAGRGRLAAGDEARALESFRRAMREGSSHTGAVEAARAAHDMRSITNDDRLLIGRTLLAAGGIDRGLPMIEAYLASPGVPAADRATLQMEVGRQLFNARRYEPAERMLRGAAGTHPEAVFLLGRTLYRAGEEEAGVQRFAEVARQHPGTRAAADALFLLGDLAHDEPSRRNAAAEYYRQAIATGAHNVSAADASTRLAGIHLIAGNARAAATDLQAYLATRPRDPVSIPALYWLGRAQLQLGQQDSARTTFRQVMTTDPFSYHGMLAAARLNTSLAAVELPNPPAPEPEAAAAIEFAFFRIDLLGELGLQEEATVELARLQAAVREDVGALYAVAEAMSEHGQPIAGALLGREIQARTRQWDERLLRIVYQFPYRDLVVREAERHSMDPFMIAGLIRQESFFNPNAVSAVGALGLMQVMPETGAGLARRAGVSGFSAASLRQPEVNVRLGTLFVADQMNRWDGRLSDVFAAYNAGPNRVVRWRQFPEHRDDEIYIERIPLQETRDYVKRLMLNGEIYRRLYSGG